MLRVTGEIKTAAAVSLDEGHACLYMYYYTNIVTTPTLSRRCFCGRKTGDLIGKRRRVATKQWPGIVFCHLRVR